MKKKLLTALLSLLISFGMWLYVITVVEPNSDATYSDIPVIFTGESALQERNLMITDGRDAEVTLRLVGNRLDLNKLNKSNIGLKVDLSKIYDPGVQRLPYNITYPGDISSGSISEEYRAPSQILLTVERKLTKDVPVKIFFQGAVPQNYIAEIDKPVLDYTHVTITGPESVLTLVDHAAVSVDLTDRAESISESFQYTLCDVNGEPVDLKELVVPNVTEVHLDLRVQKVKEIKLSLTVVDGGGATSTTSSIQIDPLTIKVCGSDAALEGLTEINLGEIHLSELLGDKTLNFEIKMPAGVTNLTGVTEAKVKISFPDLLIREFKLKTFQVINVPPTMKPDILTKELTVRVRGPKDLVRSMTEYDISAVIDFSDAVPGTATKSVDIRIADNFAAVGELGSYSVSATVTEAEKDED